MGYTVHEAPLASTLYFYADTCSYDNLDKWVAVSTIVYTHEGEEAYVLGMARNPEAGIGDDRLTISLIKNIFRLAAQKGVDRIKFRHRGRVRTIDLLGKMRMRKDATES